MLWLILILLLLIILFAVWLWLIAPQLKGRPGFAPFSGFDYAHRGLHKLSDGVPENSLAGFLLAEESGYGMEFDLQLTKDKRIVVHHDPTLRVYFLLGLCLRSHPAGKQDPRCGGQSFRHR